MALLGMLWGPTLIAAGALLAAVCTFGAVQRRVGRAEAVADSTREALRAAEVRHDIEDDLRRAGPGAADRLHDEWGRD